MSWVPSPCLRTGEEGKAHSEKGQGGYHRTVLSVHAVTLWYSLRVTPAQQEVGDWGLRGVRHFPELAVPSD